MVQTLINLDSYENKIVNLIKDTFELNSKTEAIELIIREKGQEILEPELSEEFIEELKAAGKEMPIGIKSFGELRKRLGYK